MFTLNEGLRTFDATIQVAATAGAQWLTSLSESEPGTGW